MKRITFTLCIKVYVKQGCKKNHTHWAFPEKNCYPPVEDINGKFQGGRVKVVGIPGGYTKN